MFATEAADIEATDITTLHVGGVPLVRDVDSCATGGPDSDDALAPARGILLGMALGGLSLVLLAALAHWAIG